MTPRVTSVAFVPARAQDAHDGLLGWVRVSLDDNLEVDGLVLRRNSVGELTLSFPSRVDGAGYRRYFVRPLSDAARVAIHEQVIAQLRLERRLPS